MWTKFLATIFLLSSGIATADEALVRKNLQNKYPETTIESVKKTPYFGLYEVYMQKTIIYTDERADYVILGSVIDAKTRQNLTEQRMQELTKISFDTLPLSLAIKRVKGNGKRKMALFTDPDCPYCQKLEHDLVNVTDVTIYTFLFPIASLHPAAEEISKRIWCSRDRAAAYDSYMLQRVTPTAAPTCGNPVADLVQFGQNHKINSTPTLIYADGRVAPGAAPAADVERMLNTAASK